MSRVRLTMVAAAAIVLLAGCGNKPESTPTPAPASQAVTPEGTAQPVQLTAGPYAGDPLAGGCWTEDQVVSALGERPQWSAPPAMVIDPTRLYLASIQTSKGTFDVELLPQEAPTTVNNFVCLARAGYYHDTRFHRIAAGFVVQGGDPTGTGGGNPGYSIADETPARPYARGTLAMANSGPNTSGGQFFVCLDDLSSQLAPSYNLFGTVVSGMETVDAIAATPTEASPSNPTESSHPLEEVVLMSVTVTEG